MRIEDLRIDTVLILLPEPLLRATGARPIVTDSLYVVLIVRATGPRDLKGRRMWPAVLDDESVVATSKFNSSRRSVTPLSRYTVYPTLRRKIEMRIAGHRLNLTSHSCLLVSGLSPLKSPFKSSMFQVQGILPCPHFEPLNLELSTL
jgi:hypothetical protein